MSNVPLIKNKKKFPRREENKTEDLLLLLFFNQSDTSEASMTFSCRDDFNTQHMCFQAH